MNDICPRYQCPACERAVLNRKIAKCLYCGAALPPALLLTPEQIAALEQAQRQSAMQREPARPAQGADASDIVGGVFDGIDLIGEIGSLLDL